MGVILQGRGPTQAVGCLPRHFETSYQHTEGMWNIFPTVNCDLVTVGGRWQGLTTYSGWIPPPPHTHFFCCYSLDWKTSIQNIEAISPRFIGAGKRTDASRLSETNKPCLSTLVGRGHNHAQLHYQWSFSRLLGIKFTKRFRCTTGLLRVGSIPTPFLPLCCYPSIAKHFGRSM